MTPDEHYREAERLLSQVPEHGAASPRLPFILAEAQVHATLATIYRSTERLVER
jgi:hypothetical protein